MVKCEPRTRERHTHSSIKRQRNQTQHKLWFNYYFCVKEMGSEGTIVRKPRFLCLHGFRTSGEIMKIQLHKWPQSVLDRLDLVFLDAPFPCQGKSDVEGIFDPPYYEWFQFNKVAFFFFSYFSLFTMKKIRFYFLRKGFQDSCNWKLETNLISGI